jgi:hypothetical protein
MIARVLLDGVDCTAKVLRRGVDKLVAEVADQDGNATVGNAIVTLLNFDGALTGVSESADALDLDISIGGHKLFGGTVDPENITEDRDQEVVTFEGIDSARQWIDEMGEIEMGDIVAGTISSASKVINIFAEFDTISTPANTEGRRFWSLDWLLSHLGSPAPPFQSQIGEAGTNSPWKVDLSHYFYGGKRFNDYTGMSRMTAIEFVKNVAMLFNAGFYFDNGTLVLRDKRSFLHSTDTPLNLPLIRDSFQQTVNRCGVDQVDFQFANYQYKPNHPPRVPSLPPPGPSNYGRFGGHIAIRDPNESRAKLLEKRCGFRHAYGLSVDEHGWATNINDVFAYISRSENESTYVVKNSVGIYNANWTYDLETEQLIQLWYACEFQGLTEWTGTFSILDNYTVLPELIKPYRRIVHPLGSDYKYFIRRAEIDPDAETVKVTAVGYAI